MSQKSSCQPSYQNSSNLSEIWTSYFLHAITPWRLFESKVWKHDVYSVYMYNMMMCRYPMCSYELSVFPKYVYSQGYEIRHELKKKAK